MALFHLACNVTDLDEARAFYGGLLGCSEGRSTETWIDYNFFGHQLTLHLGTPFNVDSTGHVDGKMVPMPHFGAILEMDAWNTLAERLTRKNLNFILAPSTRFVGRPGEQSTMFFLDPSGNPIEIKGVSDMDVVFAS